MEIKEEVEITLTPEELGEIIQSHFQKKYDIDTVKFNVESFETTEAIKAKMTHITCIGKIKK